MRITNHTMARNYTSNLNRELGRLNKNNLKVATGRQYMNMYENTSNSVRAMTVRRSIANIDGYMDNAKSAKGLIAGAEKTLGQISDITKSVTDKFTVGISDHCSEGDREIIATELEKLRDQIILCANGQYADRYLFGGTNTQSQPFTVDKDSGELYYNGVKVQDIDKNDPKYAYLFEDASYIDIGIGMTMQSGASSQDVVPNSVFKNTMVGLDFIGSGKDNIYNVINDLVETLRDNVPDKAASGALLDKFKDVAGNLSLQLTKLGSDDNYLDFTISRLENDYDNLVERQDALEFVDQAGAITDLLMQEYVYNAALSMGSRLLQPNIFSFMR